MAGASTRSQADVRIKTAVPTFWDWEFEVRDPKATCSSSEGSNRLHMVRVIQKEAA